MFEFLLFHFETIFCCLIVLRNIFFLKTKWKLKNMEYKMIWNKKQLKYSKATPAILAS